VVAIRRKSGDLATYVQSTYAYSKSIRFVAQKSNLNPERLQSDRTAPPKTRSSGPTWQTLRALPTDAPF